METTTPESHWWPQNHYAPNYMPKNIYPPPGYLSANSKPPSQDIHPAKHTAQNIHTPPHQHTAQNLHALSMRNIPASSQSLAPSMDSYPPTPPASWQGDQEPSKQSHRRLQDVAFALGNSLNERARGDKEAMHAQASLDDFQLAQSPYAPYMIAMAVAGAAGSPFNRYTRDPVDVGVWIAETEQRIEEAKMMTDLYFDAMRVNMRQTVRNWTKDNGPSSWSITGTQHVQNLVKEFHSTPSEERRQEIRLHLQMVQGKTIKAVEAKLDTPPTSSICDKTEQETRHSRHRREARWKAKIDKVTERVKKGTKNRRDLLRIFV